MKKKILKFSFMTSIILLVASCTKQPTASFKLSKSTAVVGESITATFDGDNSNTYIWSAWDGAVSQPTGASSGNVTSVSGGDHCDNSWTMSFSAAGTYTIYLSAKNYKDGCDCTDCSGKEDEFTKTVTIQ